EVRNQTEIPENNRYRKVGGDCENVPKQRGIKIHPKGTELIGNRHHPVSHPHTSHVKDRENGSTYYGKDGHCLCGTIDPHSPALAEKQQYGRDQRSGVTDTDPPNKIGNVPCPSNGFIRSPCTDAGSYRIGKAAKAPQHGNKCNGKCSPPHFVGFAFNR